MRLTTTLLSAKVRFTVGAPYTGAL
jgi:hypothetical protein